MSGNSISKIKLKGYKSIKEMNLNFNNLNIIVGANGVGKSNLLSVFKLLQNILEHQLQYFIAKNGGPDAFLHYGRKVTENFEVELHFENNSYQFSLEPAADNQLLFSREFFCWHDRCKNLGSAHLESKYEHGSQTEIDNNISFAIKSWNFYHFHDTSETAYVKQRHGLNDNIYLRSDARNLAAYLFFLKNSYPKHYYRIIKTIQIAAPFFGDFILRPHPQNSEQIELEWHERFNDIPLKTFMLSDGTLRFMCLATALLQPEEKQPETIIIDEPELALHPATIALLAGMLRSASVNKQIIVATQSSDLVSEFEPENLIVCERMNGLTSFQRPNLENLKEWLQDFSLGELWKKNIFGGRPTL